MMRKKWQIADAIMVLFHEVPPPSGLYFHHSSRYISTYGEISCQLLLGLLLQRTPAAMYVGVLIEEMLLWVV